MSRFDAHNKAERARVEQMAREADTEGSTEPRLPQPQVGPVHERHDDKSDSRDTGGDSEGEEVWGADLGGIDDVVLSALRSYADTLSWFDHKGNLEVEGIAAVLKPAIRAAATAALERCLTAALMRADAAEFSLTEAQMKLDLIQAHNGDLGSMTMELDHVYRLVRILMQDHVKNNKLTVTAADVRRASNIGMRIDFDEDAVEWDIETKLL